MHTLEDLESGALAGVRHVRLTQLGLDTFPPQLFALADTLEVLDLSGNQLSALPDDLHRLHRLRILFASGNPFQVLPSALGRCRQLEMIGFKACAIEHVPDDSLPPALRWLILTDNRITQLPASLGQRLRLQKLMLSCNRLRSLPDLSGCTRLELLRIASNAFTQLPDTLLQLPALCWPALAGNPLTQQRENAALVAPRQHAWGYTQLAIGGLLGEGASGQIFAASDPASGQHLALKVFKAAYTSDGTPQSELAAGLTAGQHPHLLTPLAQVHGHPEGKLATALPLLPPRFVPLAGPPDFDSCTRDVHAADAVFAPDIAQRLLSCIHAALGQLHARGVLHGDLYAHNILWDPASGEALLSDFGAALLTDGLPPALVAQLQAIEWRAFAILQQEIHSRVCS
jgi:hypothetical protein